MSAGASESAAQIIKSGSGPWTDLGLTLPIFIGYHLGVITLPVRNAADLVTRELVSLANHNLLAYGGLTLSIGIVYAGILIVAGRGQTLHWSRFGMISVEAVVYAVAMRLLAGYVVGRVFLMSGAFGAEAAPLGSSAFAGFVMSLGAGFYEEIAFRVGLYGLGSRLLLILFPMPIPFKATLVKLGWAAVAAAIFSGWHYIGDLGDPFEPRSFVFRWVCGLVFTAIYAFRGFAPAVWTHALYDIWVLVF